VTLVTFVTLVTLPYIRLMNINLTALEARVIGSLIE
jgi:hypothetical protein